MYRILLLILFGLCITSQASGQLQLGASDYEHLSRKAEQLEKQVSQMDTVFDSWETKEPFFIFDSFTQQNAEECLVIYPYPYPYGARRRYIGLILLGKNMNNEWKARKWKSEGGTEITLTDVNQDGIQEIIIKNSNYGQGSLQEEYILLSLIDNKEKVLYENHSYNSVDFHNSNNLSLGDEVVKEVEVSYKKGKDGSIRILQKTKIGSVVYLDKKAVSDMLEYEIIEETIPLKIEVLK